MDINSKLNYSEDAALSDQVGKVFAVLGQDKRKCMICEQVLTRTESGEHANLICYPAACETRP